MARRTTILIDDEVFTKLLKVQAREILATNSSVSVSSIINKIVAEKLDSDQTKIITGLVIENILLGISKKTMQDIGKRLHEKHGVYFANYYEDKKPLHDVLKEEFGSASQATITKIDSAIAEHQNVKQKHQNHI